MAIEPSSKYSFNIGLNYWLSNKSAISALKKNRYMEWSKQNAVDCYGGLNLQIGPDIQIGAFNEAKLDLLSRVGLNSYYENYNHVIHGAYTQRSLYTLVQLGLIYKKVNPNFVRLTCGLIVEHGFHSLLRGYKYKYLDAQIIIGINLKRKGSI